MANQNGVIPGLPGVEIDREVTRKYIAYSSIAAYFLILAVIVAFGLIGWLTQGEPLDEMLKVLTTTAGILGGVVGAVVGFYFRAQE